MIVADKNGFVIKLFFVNSLLFKYPFPTHSPDIYISPLTPTGTGFRLLSKIYICELYIGFPIVI